MTTLTESELRFEFDEEWHIKKYDTTPYYLAISGSGMSAVDFVGLWKGKVVLIEVKNYRNRPPRELERNQEKLEGNPPKLLTIFQEKIQESMTGISVIRKFLLRKWRYRQLDKLLSIPRLLPFLLRSERLFWMYIDQKIKHSAQPLQAILWLELPNELKPSGKRFQLQFYEATQRSAINYAISSTANNIFENSIRSAALGNIKAR